MKLLQIKGPRSVYLISLLIGAASGLGALAFNFVLAFAEHVALGLLAGFQLVHAPGEFSFHFGTPRPYSPWVAFLLPAVGGLCAGVLVQVFCPDARGNGTDQTIDAFHNQEGKMNARVPLFKALATILTVGSGGSAGKEGPTAQIGAGIGVMFARLANAGPRARRTFLLAGTAGGLGAIFRAPLGGALTAVEMVYKEDIESDSLIPCVISSVTAYLITVAVAGPGSVYQVAAEKLTRVQDLPFYVLLGLLCFFTGYIFINFFTRIQGWFQKLPGPALLRPMLGGLIAGVIGLGFPAVLGTGSGFLQKAVTEGVTPFFGLPLLVCFVLLALMKIGATTASIASGGSGGMFGPSLFIGCMLGGLTAELAGMVDPGASHSAFMLVGMGAFYAGVARAPIAGMIMVCEMIGSYVLLPPLMVVAIVGFLFTRRLSIYRGQVENRFQSPAHHWDMNLDILGRMTIQEDIPEIRDIAVVNQNEYLSSLNRKSTIIQASDFVVRGPNQSYVGIVSLRRVRIYPEEDLLSRLVTAGDAADKSIRPLSPESTVGEALSAMMEAEVDKIAIVKDGKLLGYVRYTDVMRAYHKKARRDE